MCPADTDDLPQVTTVMRIETIKLCFFKPHVPMLYVSTGKMMLSRAVTSNEDKSKTPM